MIETTAASTKVPVPSQLIGGRTVLVPLAHDGDNLGRSGRALLAAGWGDDVGDDRLRVIAAGERITL